MSVQSAHQTPLPKSEDTCKTTSRRIYQPPQLEDLGGIEVATQGPSSGSIDLLIGSTGGFGSAVS